MEYFYLQMMARARRGEHIDLGLFPKFEPEKSPPHPDELGPTPGEKRKAKEAAFRRSWERRNKTGKETDND